MPSEAIRPQKIILRVLGSHESRWVSIQEKSGEAMSNQPLLGAVRSGSACPLRPSDAKRHVGDRVDLVVGLERGEEDTGHQTGLDQVVAAPFLVIVFDQGFRHTAQSRRSSSAAACLDRDDHAVLLVELLRSQGRTEVRIV